MYTSVYLYRVAQDRLERFLQIQREAAAIYRRYGALDDTTSLARNLEAKYGCLSFEDAFAVADHEVVLIGMSSFRDREHYEEVMQLVDADERINHLYQEVTKLIDVQRVVRGEFEQVI